MGFSHIDDKGDPSMVNVGRKDVTMRSAKARCFVVFPKEVARALREQDWKSKKGPIRQTAILAGVMGAKKTSELIPLCHPLALEDCQVTVAWKDDETLEVRCTASLHGKTGVEMEALTGASVAALTIYDMCKGMSHDITIRDLELIAKTGGKHEINKET